MERTLVLIKPDGVKRGLVGRILQRFEDAGYKIVAAKMVWADKKIAGKHYFDVEERHGKKIFEANVKFMSEGPVIALVIEGIEAITGIRKITGTTEPKSSPPGTIRGDFAHQSYGWMDKKSAVVRNLIHASSSKKDAKHEIALWFKKSEIHPYQTVYEPHTF